MYASGISHLFTFGLRQLAQNQSDIQTSLERLSTGNAINRASDDPSGMIAIEQHKVEIYSLNKQLDAFAQQEGFLGAKEGGLSVLSDMMIELADLTVRAANTGAQGEGELEAIQVEINSIITGIDQIAQNTTFKGQSVMQEYTSANLDDDLRDLASIVASDPEKAQKIVEQATDQVATTRGAIGNQLKEIDSRRRVIGEQLTNLNASLSSIQDTDYAAESAKLVRSQILEQASIAAIDISRQSATQVLDLLDSSIEFAKSNA